MKPIINNNSIAIALNGEAVTITPKDGNVWNTNDLYGHLKLAGFDPDDDNINADHNDGVMHFSWKDLAGNDREAWIPDELFDLLEPVYLGTGDVIAKLERQTEQCGPDQPEEDLEAKRIRNEGRKPEDLEF